MAELNFNAENVDPGQTDFAPLPPGEYPVIITGSEMRANNAGTGQYLWLEMDIIDGEHQGRKLWDRLSLEHTNPQTVEIAQQRLSQICHAVGVMAVSDSQELHDKPMFVRVKVKPATDKYEASNDVKGYKPLNQAAPAPAPRQQPQPAAVAQPAKPSASVPPWKQAKAS